jgi:hypothetical protein
MHAELESSAKRFLSESLMLFISGSHNGSQVDENSMSQLLQTVKLVWNRIPYFHNFVTSIFTYIACQSFYLN